MIIYSILLIVSCTVFLEDLISLWPPHEKSHQKYTQNSVHFTTHRQIGFFTCVIHEREKWIKNTIILLNVGYNLSVRKKCGLQIMHNTYF